MNLQERRDLTFLLLSGLFLGTMAMLNILGLTRFVTLGSIGGWPLVVAVGAAAWSWANMSLEVWPLKLAVLSFKMHYNQKGEEK